MATWKSSPDLMARLIRAQNHPVHSHIDIMTFAGMCDTRGELDRHVRRYEGYIARHEGIAAVMTALGLKRQRRALAA